MIWDKAYSKKFRKPGILVEILLMLVTKSYQSPIGLKVYDDCNFGWLIVFPPSSVVFVIFGGLSSCWEWHTKVSTSGSNQFLEFSSFTLCFHLYALPFS